MRALPLLLTGLLASSAGSGPAPASAPAPLEVEVVGLRNREGVVQVAVYDGRESWLKLPRALRVQQAPIGGAAIAVRFADLPPGTYAISVIHDENANDKLDMKWFPYPHPAEGAGASNDPVARFGPPSWEDSAFRLGQAGARLRIQMRY